MEDEQDGSNNTLSADNPALLGPPGDRKRRLQGRKTLPRRRGGVGLERDGYEPRSRHTAGRRGETAGTRLDGRDPLQRLSRTSRRRARDPQDAGRKGDPRARRTDRRGRPTLRSVAGDRKGRSAHPLDLLTMPSGHPEGSPAPPQAKLRAFLLDGERPDRHPSERPQCPSGGEKAYGLRGGDRRVEAR